MADKKFDTKLSLREKIAIHIMLFVLKIVHPWDFEHQVEEHLRTIKELLKQA